MYKWHVHEQKKSNTICKKTGQMGNKQYVDIW